MEFFEGWKALNSRFDKGDLTALTQLVGYKLFVISDEQRFPEVLRVSDRELMNRTGIQSKGSIQEAKRRLKNAGLIDFRADRTGTQYRWRLQGTSGAPTRAPTGARGELPNIRVRDPCDPEPLGKESIAREAQEHWRSLGGGRLSEVDKQRLAALEAAHGLAWVKAAMQTAHDINNNPRGLSPKLLMGVLARQPANLPAKPARQPSDDAAALLEQMMTD